VILIRFIVALCAGAALMNAAQAQSLAKPRGPVVLTVTGAITQRNAGEAAEFDLAMLEALPVSRFTTATRWRPAPAAYAGPSLAAVLKAVGAKKGKTLRLIALDKYEVAVPFDDAAKFGPLLAISIDGKRLSVSDLGPIWMIYPFDGKPELKNETYYGRSIWQLQRIVID
jgi:hypothetical protein